MRIIEGMNPELVLGQKQSRRIRQFIVTLGAENGINQNVLLVLNDLQKVLQLEIVEGLLKAAISFRTAHFRCLISTCIKQQIKLQSSNEI